MDINELEYKQTEVTYKFYLPDNKDELITFQNSINYLTALNDIYDRCRQVWKYKEDATEEEVKLAERIGEIVTESGCF